MSVGFPPERLTCPDPDPCPVAVDRLRELCESHSLPATELHRGSSWFRVYDAQDGYADPNPGFGNSRFAPFDDARSRTRVATMYLAESLEAALLETALHGVTDDTVRVVPESRLLGSAYARVLLPRTLTVADLRDEQLKTLGLNRSNVSSSSQEHYPCTRSIAKHIHASNHDLAGIIWHSRQAELNGRPAAEVAALFADRIPRGRDVWRLHPSDTSAGSLLNGAGRIRLDELAESLHVTILGEF